MGNDLDTQVAYYMFVNHGRFPSEIAALPDREKYLVYEMALKEIRNRPKK